MPEYTPNEDISVLIVEDEMEVQRMYTTWLDDYYTVTTAGTGKDALAEVFQSSGQFDVILLDRKLPDISGTAVLDAIHRHTDDCRIAIITAVKPEKDVLEMDFDAYVEKPVTKEKLYNIVRDLYQRTQFEADLTKYYAIAEKLATLKTHYTEVELQSEESYQDLLDELAELEIDMNHSVDFTDPNEVEQIIYDAINQP